MKKRSFIGVVLFTIFFFSLPIFAFTPWAEGADSVDNLVVELRNVYEKGLAAKAASPDFLQDLDNLISRLELATSSPNVSTVSITNLMSEAVEVLVTNSFPRKEESLGQVFRFLVRGTDSGSIWGTGVYTSDSNLDVAAVHAGILKTDEAGIVAARALQGLDQYEASTRNGITSRSYGSWSLSYEFVDVDQEQILIQDPGNLNNYRGFVGQSLAFLVTGDTGRGIWGTDIYTIDSHLATASVHAGILREGETGVVLVEFLPGQDSYWGTSNFGVSSSSFGSYPFSYSLKKVQF